MIRQPHPIECDKPTQTPQRIELPNGYWKHYHAGMGSIFHADGTEIYYCGLNQLKKLIHTFAMQPHAVDAEVQK